MSKMSRKTSSSEKIIKHLWDCANALSAETHIKRLLKSQYLQTCRKITKRKLQLPQENFSASKMCPRCCSLWNESEFKLKLKPQGITATAKAERLIAKLEECKITKKKELTKKQKRRAKWLKKRVTSNIQIHCEFCQHNTLIPLEKPNKKVKSVEPTNLGMVQEQEPLPTKAKKRKNKNKTAGLKISHIREKVNNNASDSIKKSAIPNLDTKQLTTEPHSKAKQNTFKTSLITIEEPKLEKLKQVPSKNTLKNSTPAKSETKPKSHTNLSQTLKTSKKPQKQKKKSTKSAAVAPVKVQSNTQQKNSLLQLAALLKKQTGTSEKSTTQKRLELLLK